MGVSHWSVIAILVFAIVLLSFLLKYCMEMHDIDTRSTRERLQDVKMRPRERREGDVKAQASALNVAERMWMSRDSWGRKKKKEREGCF